MPDSLHVAPSVWFHRIDCCYATSEIHSFCFSIYFFHDKKNNRNVRIIAGCNAGNFVETPVNTQHTLGSNNVLRLNCSARFYEPSTNQLEWVGRADSETLTENGAVKPQWRHKYEIQGDFDLVFKDPELSDAGKYECRTGNESTENLRHNVQVIISGEVRICIIVKHILV